MLRKNLILIVLLTVFFAPSAWASKEGMLPLSTFSMRSAGLDSSGAVEVSGTQTLIGITSLKVNAFAHEFALGPSDLAQLRGYQANGIQISFEHGYKNLGGRMLYVTLTRGFTSGLQCSKLVSVSEAGAIKVFDGEPCKE